MITIKTLNSTYTLTQTEWRGIYIIQGTNPKYFNEPTQIMVEELPKVGEPFWVSPIEGIYKGRNSVHTSQVVSVTRS